VFFACLANVLILLNSLAGFPWAAFLIKVDYGWPRPKRLVLAQWPIP
jgi:hypothetical protein